MGVKCIKTGLKIKIPNVRFKRLLFILCMLVSIGVIAGNGVEIKTVVIDPGHGGKDPGASGPDKTNEKDVALNVALRLGELIKKNFPDVNVIYTRKTDVFVELHERADIANKSKADLFIAIHCNSNPNPQVYGTSTYVLGLHRTEANLEVAKRENSVILLESDHDKNYEFDPNSPEGNIIMSMKQNAYLDQSIDIASKMENEYETNSKRKSLGVKQAGFYVLYKTTMPSILSEIGFISNPDEEKFLASAKGQEQIATSILKAFKDYKFEMENKQAEPEASNNPGAASTDTKTGATGAKTDTAGKQPGTATGSQPDEATSSVTTLSGRKIRKPIEDASGGGIAPASETTPVAATEPPKKQEQPATPPSVKKDTVAATARTKPASKPAVDSSATATSGANKASNTGSSSSNKPAPKAGTDNTTSASVTPVKKEPTITETKTAPKPAAPKSGTIQPRAAESGMVFVVQLFAIKGEPKKSEYDRILRLFDVVSSETIDNGIIRYFAGDEKHYASAKKIQEKAIADGYKDAFIIGYKDGKRMSPSELRAAAGQ